MSLISAEEAKNITKEALKNSAIERVMSNILNKCKDGQFGLRITEDSYPEDTINYIVETLTNLGYNVNVKTGNYAGSLKKYITVNINWYD